MTPAERLRKHQRALEKTQRELDRERVKLENQEKKLIVEIKKNAKAGQMGACKIQAKDLVRTRRYVVKHSGLGEQRKDGKWRDGMGIMREEGMLTSPQIYREILLDAHATTGH